MAEISAFKINGVIDTSKSVLSNIDVLCRASGCWLTYDSTTALWSVIINRAGSSVKSFTDANIIGSISITGSGIDSMYNSVEVTYPNQDLLNNRDSVNFTVPNASRFPNELDKKLTISLDCINNEIQAAYIGAIELNQNRIDKIIQFKTDYSVLGLKAGDLIDITTTMYGYTQKVFRITKVAEEDADDGTIQLSITALEYDETVYSTAGLVYTARTTATGVVPKSSNTALGLSDRIGNSSIIATATISTGTITSNFQSWSGTTGPTWASGIQTGFTPPTGGGPTQLHTVIDFRIGIDCPVIQITATTPLCTLDYQFLDHTNTIRTRTNLTLYAPTQWQLQKYVGSSWVELTTVTTDWMTQNLQFPVAGIKTGDYRLVVDPIVTYDLNQPNAPYIFTYKHNCLPDSAGNGITLIVEGKNV
jgi:hypothetical protein